MLKDRLNALIEEYVNEEGTDAQSALRDILTDLRHIADEKDLDFDYAGVGSEEVYLEENLIMAGLTIDPPTNLNCTRET